LTSKQQIIKKESPKDSTASSWIDSRRVAATVFQEGRDHPRIDCDCPTSIAGYSFKARITDFSISGCFVECDEKLAVTQHIGKTLNLAIKFATEDQVLDLQAKVARVTNRGIACEFVSLTAQHLKALRRFFDFAKETQPLF
jgi:hypothetical protein